MHSAYFLNRFSHIRPKFELQQRELLEWIAKAHHKSDENADVQAVLLKLGLRSDKIHKRATVLLDCTHTEWDEMELYHFKNQRKRPDFASRSRIYEREVDLIFDSFFPPEADLPSHLIHVTCTGYVSPSGAQKLVSNRKAATEVIHAYHMGCYAAIPALRIALGLTPKDVALVHTEVCSLHMDPADSSMQQLVVHTLFADGFIKYHLCDHGPGFEVISVLERIIPDTQHLMSWKSEEGGLKMTLSIDVPEALVLELPAFLKQLRASKDAFYAIHPGGPKIIQQIAQGLNLKPHQFYHSEEILKNCGNMSSATLPHIWEKMWQDPGIPDGTEIVSLAFGPGLTLAGAVFRCRR